MDQVHLYKDLYFPLPKQPKRVDIQGYGFQKKNQRWRRTELPDGWDDIVFELEALDGEIGKLEEELDKKEKKIESFLRAGKVIKRSTLNPLIEAINERILRYDEVYKPVEKFAFEEDRKCTEGIWFYNNGVATFVTGDHYHYLNWFKLDVGYPQYRDRDKRWFYHWFLCDNDPNCLGQDYGKLRRDGYSFRVMSVVYNRARKTMNAKYGLISKTQLDSDEMFSKGIDAFMEYPIFFKPQVYSAEDVKKKIQFKTPQQRVTYKTRKTKKEISLNTDIESFPTRENSMDSSKRKIISADESGKWPAGVSVEKWFSIAKKCCMLGSTIIGKVLMGSTVNEASSGGAEFQSIWEISDHTNLTRNGRTASGLWRYFVDSADGMEGFIDEYGMSVIETPDDPVKGIDGAMITMGAAEYLQNEFDGLKKSGKMVAYWEARRQSPRDEDDMFLSAANEDTPWDIDKIHQQLEHNAVVSVDREIVHGYFEWANGNRDCGVVRWMPVPVESHLAKHSFVWFPEPSKRNMSVLKLGKKAPANSHVGLFTLDPYSAVATTDGRQSKAASHAFKKFDFAAANNRSEVYVGEYWNRLRDPLLVYEDMIMQSVYFGWPLMPERNVRTCNDYFRNRGYDKYLMDAPFMSEEDYLKNKNKIQDQGIANVTGKTRFQLVEYLASYIANHIGVNEQTGEMGYMPFDNTLKDWLKFDISKWTPFDLTVSSMLAPTAVRGYTPNKKKIKRLNLFPQYRMENGVMVRFV